MPTAIFEDAEENVEIPVSSDGIRSPLRILHEVYSIPHSSLLLAGVKYCNRRQTKYTHQKAVRGGGLLFFRPRSATATRKTSALCIGRRCGIMNLQFFTNFGNFFRFFTAIRVEGSVMK